MEERELGGTGVMTVHYSCSGEFLQSLSNYKQAKTYKQDVARTYRKHDWRLIKDVHDLPTARQSNERKMFDFNCGYV